MHTCVSRVVIRGEGGSGSRYKGRIRIQSVRIYIYIYVCQGDRIQEPLKKYIKKIIAPRRKPELRHRFLTTEYMHTAFIIIIIIIHMMNLNSTRQQDIPVESLVTQKQVRTYGVFGGGSHPLPTPL